ncbi:MAG: Mov34/MPN/PAD-1 family protein [Candidatus Woesearchaeota archaeon]
MKSKNNHGDKIFNKKGLKERIVNWFNKFLFEDYKIKSIVIKEEIIESIIDFAKQNHPKEFVAFLGGSINKNNILEINKLLYQRFYSSKDSAYFRIEIPITERFFGTVHNHPTNSNIPSLDDLFLFGKYGFIHLIISFPYNKENIAAYNFKGEKIHFEIIK